MAGLAAWQATELGPFTMLRTYSGLGVTSLRMYLCALLRSQSKILFFTPFRLGLFSPHPFLIQSIAVRVRIHTYNVVGLRCGNVLYIKVFLETFFALLGLDCDVV